MAIMHKIVLLLLVAAAAPAFATRVMLGEINAKGETLTCMSTVVKVSRNNHVDCDKNRQVEGSAQAPYVLQ
jgi:hypothetical protein